MAPASQRVTVRQVTAPVTARLISASRYYTHAAEGLIGRCRPGETPVAMPNLVVVDVSFAAPVAVGNADSLYAWSFAPVRGCAAGGGSDTSLADIRAERRVTFQELLPVTCGGTVAGTVRYVPNTGPMGYGMAGIDSTVRGLRVGRFSLRLP